MSVCANSPIQDRTNHYYVETESCDDVPEQKTKVEEKKKPFLPPPSDSFSVSAFTLFFKMCKASITSEYQSYSIYKMEVQQSDIEAEETHKKEAAARKEGLEKEKTANRWGILAKIASWIGSIVSIVTGAILIATGVGAVAGALMIAGGVITLANQIMEVSGGWQKVTDLIPGEDRAKKAAICSWIQIGVAVSCLIVSGIGIIFGGGMATLGESMQKIMMAFSGIAQGAAGMASIGMGVNQYYFKNKIADAKEFEMAMVKIQAFREEAMKCLENNLDHLMQIFEWISMQLSWLKQIGQFEQSVFKR